MSEARGRWGKGIPVRAGVGRFGAAGRRLRLDKPAGGGYDLVLNDPEIL